MKKIFRLLIFFIPILLIGSIIVGEDFIQTKKFRDWLVYSSKKGTCFLASKAKNTKSMLNSTEILGRNRENSFIYFMLDKQTNSYSISYFSDFSLQKNSYVNLRIDDKKEISLRIIGSENAGSSKNAQAVSISTNDVNLLISGSKITIFANAIDNSSLIDQFSLIGFTKSLKYLSSRCI